MMRLAAHWRTIAPTVRHLVRPRPEPEGARAWSGRVEDPERGTLPLEGRLHLVPGAREVLLVVHGLGGSHESFYAVDAARAAAAAGVSSLRFSLRGAGERPSDIYHAGLTADVHAALAHEDLADFERVYVLGYSMGGNIALRFAAEETDARVRAVAAACAPVDLDACCRFIDHDAFWLYRRWILDGLKAQYGRVAARAEVPTSADEARRFRSFREWDGRTVAPRFGFESAADYYQRMSSARLFGDLKRPALLVQSRHDPIVSAAAVREHLDAAPEGLRVCWVDAAGHLGFPSDIDLGLGLEAHGGFEAQALAWMRAHRD
ncbi:MAG: alpha/beta fold hydrolase [Planctomycetota bacterium]